MLIIRSYAKLKLNSILKLSVAWIREPSALLIICS